ncbi:MAG: 2-oxo acid dehydrogenase subunit E2 [Cytophagaceae bacterium]|nr:2-oxo acid dehydrogenase subunit E2 [Cytophagaceae bacterium]
MALVEMVEVATDKVDTEIPATHSGILKQILAEKGQVVKVGAVIAIIETEADTSVQPNAKPIQEKPVEKKTPETQPPVEVKSNPVSTTTVSKSAKGKFFSPLVLNIARQENISMTELELIQGTGKDGRITKSDILQFIELRKSGKLSPPEVQQEVVKDETKEMPAKDPVKEELKESVKPATSLSGNVEIIEMDRMRKMISERMLESKRISPHVTSFVEADVTNIVYWRNRMKNDFMEREGAALTLTPIFIEAVARALKDYPMVNISVEGDKIIRKKDINIGMAVALPSGNLIVPVIKNADQLNLIGLTKQVNELARKARNNKLTPDDLANGTYSVSNVGSFGNLMGTPIIMQPQCAILALGAVIKKPAVIETDQGDTIGIRHMMFLSHSYDHRVIDGSLGGMFVRRVADYLESFDLNRKVF